MTPDSRHDHTRRSRDERPVSRLPRKSRQFGDDGRAAAEVIGAILMFGLVMSLLVLIQVNAVPAQNQQVEFEHNQRVQQDMLNLDRAILHSGTENVPASTQLELAARYPTRFFLLNPGVGSGTIETIGDRTITVSNAQAPSAATYWDGSDKTFDTTTVRYRPSYNEYANAPVTVYEHNTLVNRFDSGAALPINSGSFIEDDQLLLLLVDGQLSTASTGVAAVETVPLSAPAQTMTIKNETNSGITLTLPTTLDQSQWETLLDPETVANDGNVADIAVSSGTPYNTLTVTLQPGSYKLRMARVGVGSSVNESALGPHYVTRVGEERTESIRGRETKRVTVQVRDRFNNPVEGDVTFTATNGRVLRPNGTWTDSFTKSSNESGVVATSFLPTDGFEGTGTVTAEQDFNGKNGIEPREQTTFDIPIQTSNVETTTDDSVSRINPSGEGDIVLESVELVNQQTNTVRLVFNNTGTEDRQMLRARLLFFMASSGDVAQSATINNNPNDEIVLFGDWDDIDQTIVVPGGGTETVDLRFTDAGNKDLFGITVEFNGYTANYFIQVP